MTTMMDAIDYDAVAELYDLYTSVSYDYDFFLGRVSPGERVLELMAGTGRLSIPLIKAGAVLTCVDISQGMLDVLERKLEGQGLEANILCTDVQHLGFDAEFECAILPFQSFMELVGRKKQMNALRSVCRALIPKGKFYCTMHNPAVRRTAVDGILRGVGAFKHGQETIVVSGFETGGEPVVRRSQFIERFNESGQSVSRILQRMEFELIEENTFREMALEVGFEVKAIFGDYSSAEFDAETSPVMIWELEKSAA